MDCGLSGHGLGYRTAKDAKDAKGRVISCEFFKEYPGYYTGSHSGLGNLSSG
ncbi:hypothetical protein COO91_00663 [Nostoc flagelliforme CCNUN1]|uniref:Uncharacterized protein n=1 Tax=Nostoc flagelliforme CCNUN1 TaxID=2038116 RepID=A0A2K8SHD1_9NOSO|nr:hypothetical protein COO91_00663 [Nostoc flagelliforme CCNUN1]